MPIQSSTVSVESKRLEYNITHVVLNIIGISLTVIEYRTYLSEEVKLEFYHGDSLEGQRSCRIAFFVIVVALTIFSLFKLLMHCLSRRREYYILNPVDELVYDVFGGALLTILSVCLKLRSDELQRSTVIWHYNPIITLILNIFGIIDALAYFNSAFKLGSVLREKIDM